MQRPLHITEEMLKEIEDETAKVVSREASDSDLHDSVGEMFGYPRIRRRNKSMQDSPISPPGPEDNPEAPRQVEEILAERGGTHGDFGENAHIAQLLKDGFRNQHGWGNLSYTQREALDLMALKLSRILSGNADHADHWQDIAGYATLAARSITNA